MWDYDEVGTTILIDGPVDNQPRKVATHCGAQRFPLFFDRTNGQTILPSLRGAHQLDARHRSEDR
jgi:glucose dehydrogenase